MHWMIANTEKKGAGTVLWTSGSGWERGGQGTQTEWNAEEKNRMCSKHEHGRRKRVGWAENKNIKNDVRPKTEATCEPEFPRRAKKKRFDSMVAIGDERA